MEYIILDIIIAAIFLVFMIQGARKGLILTLASLVVVLAAAIGAGICADTFAPALAEKLEGPIYSVLQETLAEAQAAGEAGLEEFTFLGMNFDFAVDIYHKVFESVNGLELGAAEAAAKFFADMIAKVAIAAVAFVILVIGLKLAFAALDLVAKLPVLKQMNKLGGMAAGLVTALVLTFCLITAVGIFDGLIPPEAAEKTYLYRFFSAINPITRILEASSQL